jgi:membrane protein YqaA with SNARE-associated domain
MNSEMIRWDCHYFFYIRSKTAVATANWYTRLKNRGFFRYVGRNILLIIGAYALFVLLIYLLGRYLVDFNTLFSRIIEKLSDRFVILLFFVSESFTGMVPVDLFVIWTQKFDRPIPVLALLGVLSYAGGVISYGIGTWISRWPKVRSYTERQLAAYITFVRKWGGAFIVIAALFPFTPFSLVVIAITMLKYPFRHFLLYALARLVRFVIQGIFFFDLLNIDSWVL